MTDLMVSVQRLLEDLKEFDNMDSPRQGAFRARVTRYLNIVEEEGGREDLRRILEAIRKRVGEASPKSTKKLTPGDLEEEFSKYPEYDTKRRGAYKARVTRLLNEAESEGNEEASAKLQSIQAKLVQFEENEQKQQVMKLAEELGINLE